jgi:hypothetical protein
MSRTADHTRELAAERQEPFTAAEHAEASGHGAEFTRDVPRTCICAWQWNVRDRAYYPIALSHGCPWHTTGGQ